MPKQINEFQILVVGFANLDPKEAEKLEIGDDVNLHIQGNLLKIEDSDNHDGTIDRKFKIKQIAVQIA